MGRKIRHKASEAEHEQRRDKGSLLEQVPAGQDMAVGPGLTLCRDPRLAMSANAGARAGLLIGLQRRLGNGDVQRAVKGARGQGGPAVSLSSGRRAADLARQTGESDDTLEVIPLSDGLRFSFRMQAVLDNGEPSGEPPTTEESQSEEGTESTEPTAEGEEEEEEPIEGTIGPLTVSAVEDRHTLGVINLQESTVPGGVDLQGAMGRCEPQIDAEFKVTPIGSKENRNYWLTINATVEYHWAVSAAGRKHVSSADDPIVTMENWSQIFYDLMPIAGPIPRSPRRQYWNSDLSVAHELFHRDDFSKAFKRYKPEVEAWLPTQTAADIQAARGKCDEAMRKLIGKVEGYMGTGDFAPCESRAYKAGAPAYRALALAVRRRAKLYEWPETPVERWEGESGRPAGHGGAPAGTRDASPGGGRPESRPAPSSRPILGRLPSGAIARDGPETATEGDRTTTTTPTTVAPPPVQAVTTRAGAPSTAWPELTAEQRTAILGHIRGGNGPAALTALWNALSSGLSLAGRITLERTDQPGVVDGQRIGRGGGATAMALPYVTRQPGCGGAPPDAHWRRHTADDLRVLIQVNLGAFHGTPEERLAQMHSMLMHEYTHAGQMVALGLQEGLRFMSVGEREFVSDQDMPLQQRELMAALDEIDAYASEIEQAGRTGLATTSNIRATVCELWDAYRRYFGRSEQQPDAAVAARAYRSIERGRDLYRQYLRSPQATPLPPRLLQFALTLYDCPRDYDPSILTRFAAPGTAGLPEQATPPSGP